MKLRRTLIAVVVLLSLLLSGVCAYAADDRATKAADVLYELGLFAGTGTNEDGSPIYSLDRALTRQEAMTLFINLLGKGKEAMEASWTMPFTDVDDWAKPFIGYAYAHDFTAGVAEDLFGSNDPVTSDQYMTYLLLALGYEQGTDFDWDKASVFAMLHGFHDALVGNAVKRSDAVLWNCNALGLPKKDSEEGILGSFEGKPADAKYIAADEGFLFTWSEDGKAIVALYAPDRTLLKRYETEPVETRYEQARLQAYDIGDGRSFGYYYGLEGLYRMQEGSLLQLSKRPVAQMIFTRQGPVSSGATILTFSAASPVYSEHQLFGGDTIVEILENGAENVLLHSSMNHGIEIDQIWASDSVVVFSAVVRTGMEQYRGYEYALLRKYDEASGEYRPAIQVLRYTPGAEEGGEPGTQQYDKYLQQKFTEEQQRLNELGIGQ